MPRDVVRNLLAITRALYRVELGATETEAATRLARLEEIGHMLRQALELSRVEPDTIEHRAAWSWADRGTTALGDLVATTDAKLGPVVRAAADKLKTSQCLQRDSLDDDRLCS
ncbi:MAG: hypothetical protein RL033_4865 [Pseudomonadota bacterium]|jgi:hypothetical protein